MQKKIEQLEKMMAGKQDNIETTIGDKQDDLQDAHDQQVENFNEFKEDILMRLQNLPTMVVTIIWMIWLAPDFEDLEGVFHKMDEISEAVDGIEIPEYKTPVYFHLLLAFVFISNLNLRISLQSISG